jgi:hypothetical protein
MRPSLSLPSVVAVGLVWLSASTAPAQQVTVTAPFHALNDSFFEHTGTQWGLNYKGLSVSFGGLNLAAPPFGLFDPNAGIHGGLAVVGPDYSGTFNFAAGQGLRRGFITQAPVVTLTNGYPGYVSDASFSPFVTGVVPIVGGLPLDSCLGCPLGYTPGYPDYLTLPSISPLPRGNPRVQAMLAQLAAETAGQQDDTFYLPPGLPPESGLDLPGVPQQQASASLPSAATFPEAAEFDPSTQKLATARSSSAGRAAPSVAEAQRLRQLEQAAQNEQSETLYRRGLAAEEDGKPAVAKVYYDMALENATGGLRQRILERLQTLGSSAGVHPALSSTEETE